MKKTLYRIIQWTWGFPQTLCGFFKYLKLRKLPHEEFNGAIITKWNHKGGISLGMFIFFEDNKERYDELKHHEYGHTIQSLILGPLYLLVIGLPSYIWCNLPYFRKYRRNKKISYSNLYCEKWADRIGKRIKKINSI